jgi:acyl-CoA dehydrogenase family protein 10
MSSSSSSLSSPSSSSTPQTLANLPNPIDLPALLSHLQSENVPLTRSCARITAKEFGFGQSNPTYLITFHYTGGGGQASSFDAVLRRAPLNIVHASAHNLAREFAILSHIARVAPDFPVPSVYHLCTDKAVLGAVFYIMEYVKGRIFIDPSLKGMPARERRLYYEAVVATLVNLHGIDVSDFEGFGGKQREDSTRTSLSRQVRKLLRVCEAQGTVPIGLDSLAQGLLGLVADTPSGRLGNHLIHGDYKIDNIIFHPTEPKVIGVIDWELSTVGDPMADVANMVMIYSIPAAMEDKGGGGGGSMGLVGLQGLDVEEEGIPSVEELLSCYAGGGKYTEEELLRWVPSFYLAFLFYKNAVIAHGVGMRAKQGTAANKHAKAVGSMVEVLVGMGADFLDEFEGSREERGGGGINLVRSKL